MPLTEIFPLTDTVPTDDVAQAADGSPRHFAFPFRRGDDGKVVTVAQGSPEHVMSQVNVVVRYPVGYRPENPTFGIPWPIGQQAPVNGDPIQAAVERQVPDCNAGWREYAVSTGDPASRILELDVETP